MIILPQSPKCWDYRLLCPVYYWHLNDESETQARHQWLRPINIATWEPEIQGIKV
jgi:hypothetical protein